MKKKQFFENFIHGIFLVLGLITVGCVLLISVYLIISGIPAIRQIGLIPFLFGKTWAWNSAVYSDQCLWNRRSDSAGSSVWISHGSISGKGGTEEGPHRHGIRSKSPCRNSFCCIWSRGYAGACAGDPQAVPCSGWSKPVGSHYCISHYDPAFHY